MLLLLAATFACAADKETAKKKIPSNLNWSATLETGYLYFSVTFGESITAHSITLSGLDANALSGLSPDVKVTLTIDPNQRNLDLFGGVVDSIQLPLKRITANLKPMTIEDPTKKNRRLYELEADKLNGQLFFVLAPEAQGPHQLVYRDKEGRPVAVLPLSLKRLNQEQLFPPCHPGCFPAGTMVETPDGVKKIESLGIGDVVLNVPTVGKPNPVKISSIFVGQSLIVEVDTEKDKLITTGKQPLSLASGGLRYASDLKVGDEVLTWKDGKPRRVKVRGVKPLDKPSQVYNLVLEVRGTFIANGYLVRSKPPVEP